MKAIEDLLSKLYLISAAYILFLILALGFVIPDSHFPGWVELILKATASLAGMILVSWFALYLVAVLRIKKIRLPFLMAAIGQLLGLGFVAIFLFYIKLKSCTPPDSYNEWYCQVESKNIVVTGLGLPFLGSLAGLLLGYLYELRKRLGR